MCHADNDNDDDEYCNHNALLGFLITNNMISDLHGFNFKTIICIAEYLKNSTVKAIGHSAFICICRYVYPCDIKVESKISV